jgi:protein-tyrosine phosphatase
MIQITPYPLWIGHAGECRAFAEAFARDIKVVVQLAVEEPPLQPPRELVYLRFPLLDGNGNDPHVVQLAIHCVATLMRRGTATLVGCGAGMSRSPAIVAAALSTVEHAELENCLERVTRLHPADLSPGFWEDVRRAAASVQAEGS